jgi:hypothetical protein
MREFNRSKLSTPQEYSTPHTKSVKNKSRHSFMKMDKALNSEKFFKRKYIKQKNPYCGKSSSTMVGTPNFMRNSMEHSSFKNASKRTRCNATGNSVKESHDLTDMKSSIRDKHMVGSVYNFYDSTSKEIGPKKFSRPMTADVRRLKGIPIGNILGRRMSQKWYWPKAKAKQIENEEKKFSELRDLFSEWNKQEKEVLPLIIM